MQFRVFSCIGTTGQRRLLQDNLWIDSSGIGSISQMAGSYHILEMGQHFDAYVVDGHMPAVLAPAPVIAFPVNPHYQRLHRKQTATSVTGNIGEAIAAIVGRELLGCNLSDMIHITTRDKSRRYKAPDYLFCLHGAIPLVRVDEVITHVESVPSWWVVESKARAAKTGTSAVTSAIAQLCTYWWAMSQSHPECVGYGIVSNCLLKTSPPEITLHVLIPRNSARLQAYFARLHSRGVTYQAFLNHRARKKSRFLSKYLYEC